MSTFALNGDQHALPFYTFGVEVNVLLGNTQPYQGANQATSAASYNDTCQRRSQSASGQYRADTRDGDRSNTSQQPSQTSDC